MSEVLFEMEEPGVEAPYADVERAPEVVDEELKVARTGKVPLHPAAIRFPASVSGRLASELTGYPGFAFTDQELQDLGEIWAQVGVQASPIVQAVLATVAMIAIKGLGFTAWSRTGKPGDIKKLGEGVK